MDIIRMRDTFIRNSPLTGLRIRWGITALICGLFLTAGHRLLAVDWQPAYALRWLLQAGIAMSYLLWVLWGSLAHNIRPGETALLSEFGAGNVLTILRGALIAALAGFLFLPWPQGWLAWAPGILFTIAGVSDFFDGYLARITNHATRMGEILDMSFDGVGMLAAALLAVQYGQAPVWYLLVAAARYLFLLGIWLRKRRGLRIHDLAPSVRRRAFAGVQACFLFFILMPVFSPPRTTLAAFVFAAPFLIGFLVDWLAVSGLRLNELFGRMIPGFRQVKSALAWLPAILRWTVAAMLGVRVLAVWQRSLFSPAVLADPFAHAQMILALAESAVAIFLLLGLSGRISAILGLVTLGIQPLTVSLISIQIVLIVLYTAILYLGTGPLSLWRPEERWIYRRAGERKS
jgi:CDP-diacylglycerol--glycerol-3-phosphate 3-phosphatidyltransferase